MQLCGLNSRFLTKMHTGKEPPWLSINPPIYRFTSTPLFYGIFCSLLRRPAVAGSSYKDWSTEEVCLWFDSIGFREYIPFIKEHKLRGIHLPELSKDDMIELGIKKLGDRITIDGEINKLCYRFSNIL